MNAEALKITSAISTQCVITQKVPTSVVALMVIRVMVQTAQVKICTMFSRLPADLQQ